MGPCVRQLRAVMTCFNRRALTLDCLDRFFANQVDGLMLAAIVVDDGSSDGTGDAICDRFGPRVQVIRGDGNLYWNGGMRVAMSRAMQDDADFILWLNDDTMIQPDAVAVMVRAHDDFVCRGDNAAIIAAAIADPVSGQLSYTGMRRIGSRWRPLAITRVEPGEEPQRCDTMNGNCVLLPRAVWQRLQNLDAGFAHGLGDFDYGLRATAMGIPILLAPGLLGSCPRNSDRGSFKDANLSLAERWQAITGRKGLPMREWAIYAKRHGGKLWPLYWIWPYLKVLLVGIRNHGTTQ